MLAWDISLSLACFQHPVDRPLPALRAVLLVLLVFNTITQFIADLADELLVLLVFNPAKTGV